MTMWRRLRRQPPIGDGRAESKDRVGGLFLIEAGRHDEAPRLASVHPAALPRGFDGWVAELLPICAASGSLVFVAAAADGAGEARLIEAWRSAASSTAPRPVCDRLNPP